MTAVPTVVLGATGYVGGELLRLVGLHPDFTLAAAVSGSRAGNRIADVFPHLAGIYGDAAFVAADACLDPVAAGSGLAVFSAAPHGASATLVADVLRKAADRVLDVHVVDASADFRYADAGEYESVYGAPHGAPGLLDDFTCAVPEHLAETDARHVGHPGCFATAVLLAAVPLLRSGLTAPDLFVTAITGSTGSGRSPQPGTHHPERHSNLYAYKALAHRHVPEIRNLAAAASGTRPSVRFVPHSGPFARGIFATLQATAKKPAPVGELQAIYKDAYRDSPFVNVVDGSPRLKDVVASNYSHIGLASDDDTVVVMCAIDNLVKGAAGGAMQWMNRLFDMPVTAGLAAPAPAWT